MRYPDRDEQEIMDALRHTMNVEPPGVGPRVIRRLHQPDEVRATTGRRRPRLARRALVAIVLLAILIPVTVALAIYYSSYQKLLDDTRTERAEVLIPVELAAEDQGIRFEVVAYTYADDHLIAYVTLEDTSGQGRVHEDIVNHMDFFNVYGASRTGSHIVYYDGATGILTYRIDAEYTGGEELTIEFNDLYFEPVTYEAHDTGIDLSQVAENVQTIDISGDFYTAFRRYGPIYPEDEEEMRQFEEWRQRTSGTILYPGAMDLEIPEITRRRITNIGFAEDQLRVQIWADIDDNATVYTLYLRDDEGNIVDGQIAYSYNMVDGELVIDRNCYWEWAFDVDPEHLADYRLLIDITESPSVDGTWAVTVPLEERAFSVKTARCDFDIDGISVESAVVTPLGISLYGTKDTYDAEIYSFPIELDLGDETITLTASMESASEGEITLSWGYHEDVLIDVDRVLGFTIEGFYITF